jgi:hypothetical protein
MPKVADYPRASLARTLELAAAVDRLGGDCTLEAAADELGARPGGTFGALVSTAVKYGWLTVRRGRMRTEARYRTYRLAYDEAERRAVLTDAIRAVPLFRQLLDRFAGRGLPEDHLARLLSREFDVPTNLGVRVAGYFLEAVLEAGLLASGKLRATPAGDRGTASSGSMAEPRAAAARTGTRVETLYRIRVEGPDMDSTVEISEAADLDVVRSLLAKVERALRGRNS